MNKQKKELNIEGNYLINLEFFVNFGGSEVTDKFQYQTEFYSNGEKSYLKIDNNINSTGGRKLFYNFKSNWDTNNQPKTEDIDNGQNNLINIYSLHNVNSNQPNITFQINISTDTRELGSEVEKLQQEITKKNQDLKDLESDINISQNKLYQNNPITTFLENYIRDKNFEQGDNSVTEETINNFIKEKFNTTGTVNEISDTKEDNTFLLSNILKQDDNVKLQDFLYTDIVQNYIENISPVPNLDVSKSVLKETDPATRFNISFMSYMNYERTEIQDDSAKISSKDIYDSEIDGNKTISELLLNLDTVDIQLEKIRNNRYKLDQYNTPSPTEDRQFFIKLVFPGYEKWQNFLKLI